MWITINTNNQCSLQPSLLEECKSELLIIPLTMVNSWNCQYFSLSHKTSSVFSKLLPFQQVGPKSTERD